jgi:methylated-DNA-[protein]-cysteine S-methyltransferase
MSRPKFKSEVSKIRSQRLAAGASPTAAALHSRERTRNRFNGEAMVIHWGAVDSPLGRVFVAASVRGLCEVNFGVTEGEFLRRLDPRARLESNPTVVAPIIGQLQEYFDRKRLSFTLRVDLSGLTPFQCTVLQMLARIPPGQVWTYGRLAGEIGRPKSSRPVGQALACNPIPIISPCHRVIASDGKLGGYSGGFGVESKRWLLRFEEGLPRESVSEGKDR